MYGGEKVLTTYYAIGDVHGMDDMLERLHVKIYADIEARGDEDFCVVHVGDYVDRGPDSRQVIERLMRMQGEHPESVVCLKGNHEDMMLRALSGVQPPSAMRHWFVNGGKATLKSYDGDSAVLQEHLDWMEHLPLTLRDADRLLCFVHAGIDPACFPTIAPEVALWTRSERFYEPSTWSACTEGWTIVHGHSPSLNATDPHATRGQRINVDEGACFPHPAARLACVRIAPGEPNARFAVRRR